VLLEILTIKLTYMKFNYFLLLAFLVVLTTACSEDEEQLAPVAEFTFSPESLLAGDEVQFTDNSQPGSNDIIEWTWDFGVVEANSDQQNATYVYQEEGDYDVRLFIKDASGMTAICEKVITVEDKPVTEFEATLDWTFNNGTAVEGYNDATRAAIADDGTIYYVEGMGANSQVVAVTDNGTSATKKWAYAAGVNIKNAPSVDTDGNVYIGSWAVPSLLSLSAGDGSVRWQGETGNRGVSNSSCAMDDNGNVYVSTKGSASAGLYSFSPDGTKRWEVLDLGSTYSTPALSADGSTAYFFDTSNGLVYAINASDGSFKWNEAVSTSAGYGTSISVDSDGTLYLTTDTEVVAVSDNSSSGAVKWTSAISLANSSGVVIGTDGTLYTGSSAGVYALNPADGSVKWQNEVVIEESVPAVDKNDNIYVGTQDGRLVIINSLGEKVKEFTLGNGIVNSPVMADDGTIYVESYDASAGTITLNKISVPDSAPADSAWPMKGKNRRHTSM